MQSKTCSACNENKFLDQFSPNKRGKLGRHSQCKSCMSIKRKTPEAKARSAASSRKWIEKNPERHALNTKAYRLSGKAVAATKRCKDKKLKENPALYLYWSAKSRAKVKGIAFVLDIDDIVIPEFCPVLGLKLSVGKGSFRPENASLDRFDNSLGYTKENIRVISFRANQIKNNATPEELEAVSRYVNNGYN